MAGPQRVDPARLLVALAVGLVAAVVLWLGDSYLVRRDWLPGALIFGAGLAGAGVTVRLLRRAGVGR
jgi:hypothetical protein